MRARYTFIQHPFVHVVLMTISFVILSSLAVFYSLGYQLNWATKSIQQTGIIVIDSHIPGLKADIYLNGQKKSDDFPFRYPQVFPGTYLVSIKKENYQDWKRSITVEPNKVASFRSILLLKKDLTPVELNGQLPVDFHPGRSEDIEIKDNNELWVRQNFLTRSSDNILQAFWYPDNLHLVYQAGRKLILIEPDALFSQEILTFSRNEKISFTFREDGRVLVYSDQKTIYAIELYDRF